MGLLHILLLLLSAIVVLGLCGIVYQALGIASDRRRFPPLGRVVTIADNQWHLIDSGEGIPAVIFESGISATCLNWTTVRNRVAEITRAVSYDRASLGWSDASSTPRSLRQIVEELHALIEAAGIQRPYVLTGHSFGGLIARAYAIQYPHEIAGVVLVDPLRAGEWAEAKPAQVSRLQRGIRLSRRGAILARFGVVRFALALLAGGARRIPQMVAKLSSGRGESTISRIVGEVRKMPPETWPMVRAQWCNPKSFRALADYLESLPANSVEAVSLTNLPAVPITILSAAHSNEAEIAERDAMVRSSPLGKHIIARNSGHWVHLDEPELVVQAIHELIESVRRGEANPAD